MLESFFTQISTIAEYMHKKKKEFERHNEQFSCPNQDAIAATG